MLKGVEEEFAGVAVDPFKGPSTAVVVPVSSHPQRQATIVETIVHRANQQTIFRIFREFPLYREKSGFQNSQYIVRGYWSDGKHREPVFTE